MSEIQTNKSRISTDSERLRAIERIKALTTEECKILLLAWQIMDDNPGKTPKECVEIAAENIETER